MKIENIVVPKKDVNAIYMCISNDGPVNVNAQRVIVVHREDGDQYELKKEFGKYTEIATRINFLQELLIAQAITKNTSIVYVKYKEFFVYQDKLFLSIEHCLGPDLYAEGQRRRREN